MGSVSLETHWFSERRSGSQLGTGGAGAVLKDMWVAVPCGESPEETRRGFGWNVEQQKF